MQKILIFPHLSLKDISNNFLIDFPFLFVDFISIQNLTLKRVWKENLQYFYNIFFCTFFNFPGGERGGGHLATKNLNEINSKSILHILKHIFLQDC